jgi:hypothetical protein
MKPGQRKCASNLCLRVGYFDGLCPKCKDMISNRSISKRNPIKKVSDKRSKENVEYLKLRVKFLNENTKCYVCSKSATEVHHKKGRDNSFLTDIRYFLPVCRDCHTKIELNPVWAKENGYSLNRTHDD